VQQVCSFLGYTGHDANILAEAARIAVVKSLWNFAMFDRAQAEVVEGLSDGIQSVVRSESIAAFIPELELLIRIC
jgi:hypothetical protein